MEPPRLRRVRARAAEFKNSTKLGAGAATLSACKARSVPYGVGSPLIQRSTPSADSADAVAGLEPCVPAVAVCAGTVARRQVAAY